MVRVKKEEFYNWVVEVYLKTGQGLAGFVTIKTGREPLEELLGEGKVKIFKKHYSYLPDDEWICLTDVYCVEEEEQNGTCPRALDFMRRYLGITEKSGVYQKIEEYLNENPKERIKIDNEYNAWLDKNKEILEKSFQKQKIEVPMGEVKPKINKELSEYIKDSNLFTKNFIISKALNNLSEKISLNEQIIHLLKRAIEIDNSGSSEYKQKLETARTELAMDIRVKKLLCNTNEDKKTIQDFMSEFDVN